MKTFNFKIRAVQLDLARQMETIDFIKGFIDFIATNGYNTLSLYLEGRIKTLSFPFPGPEESYTQEKMRDLVSYAQRKGIEVIPVISALGHAELFLKHSSLESLAENREGFQGRFGSGLKHVFCPSQSGTYEFLDAYFSEICELFPSRYFHVGCDESWDIGCCEFCRDRLQKGETQSDIFAKHLLAIRSIVTEKLGKRMIVWDDMFEYYPEALDALPRDVILACWQYQADVDKTKGHFNNRLVADSLEHYEQLGFEYLICPADEYTIHNVESFTGYGAGHHPLGGWMTTWSKGRLFMLQSMPMIAYAGRLWASGVSGDYDRILKDVVTALFGIDDKVFYQAIKAVCSSGLYQERRTTLSAYLTKNETDSDFSRRRLADLLLAMLPGYIDKVKGSSREVVEEIMLSLSSEQISNDLHELLPKFFHCSADHTELTQKLESHITRIECVGRSRVKMWQRVRPGISPCVMEVVYADYLKNMREIPEIAANHGFLKVHFMLPDQYSAQRTRVSIKYAGEGAWEIVGEGVFKGNAPTECFYSRMFLIRPDEEPSTIKIETSLYGGQGFTYFEAVNRSGEFIPLSVHDVTGKVTDAENLLKHDWQWAFTGERNTTAAFLAPELAESVNSFEIELIKES